MKNSYLEDDEDSNTTPGTFSYMNQDYVPYAKVNTTQNFVKYTEEDADQDTNTDSDDYASQAPVSGARIDTNRHYNIGIDLKAHRDHSSDSYASVTRKIDLDADMRAVIDTDTGAYSDLLSDKDIIKDIADELDVYADTDVNAGEPESEAEPESESEQNKTRMELYDWLQCIVSAIICGIFIFVFVGRTIGVDGSSMMKTLHNNDRVIMSNLFYTPKQGDIVVFQTSTDSFGGTPLVKRVIAVAGQTIDIDFQSGDVYIDGIVKYEPYINEPTHSRINFVGPVTVPEGFIFVMGDNRNHSSDSRDARVGLVDTRYILGRVLLVAIPGADEESPRDWSRFGSAH